MNKRRHLRAPCNVKVIVVVGEKINVSFIRNISLSGVFIETTDEYDIEQPVFLLFPLHHPEKTAKVSAKIVRTTQETKNIDIVIPGIGLEFFDTSFDFSVLIEDYIVKIKNIYEEISILINMQKPDIKRLNFLLKKAGLSNYGDFFELTERVKRDTLSLGILEENQAEE